MTLGGAVEGRVSEDEQVTIDRRDEDRAMVEEDVVVRVRK